MLAGLCMSAHQQVGGAQPRLLAGLACRPPQLASGVREEADLQVCIILPSTLCMLIQFDVLPADMASELSKAIPIERSAGRTVFTSRSQPPGCLRQSAVRNLAGWSSCSCTPWLKGQSTPGICGRAHVSQRLQLNIDMQCRAVHAAGLDRGRRAAVSFRSAQNILPHRRGRCRGDTWGRPPWCTRSAAGRAAWRSH